MAQMPLHLYVGWAIVWAAIGTALLGGIGQALGRRSTAHLLPTAFAILFFVALTQLPLPEREALSLACPLPDIRPNWVPFKVVGRIRHAWEVRPDFFYPFRHDPLLPAIMNLLLCGLIGALLSRHALRWRSAVGLGFALSLTVELTQLTGTWGFYPCAHRTFDVDDLILNTLGVALGFMAARRLRRA